MYVCMYVCMYAYMYVFMYVCLYAWMWMCIYVSMYVYALSDTCLWYTQNRLKMAAIEEAPGHITEDN